MSDYKEKYFSHTPVLFNEVIAGLNIQPGGIFADGTVGGGGHAQGILEKSAPNGLYFGVDQDEEALNAARKRLSKFGERVELVHANYADLAGLLKKRFPDGVDGVLLDIGVSSHQIDEPSRGFSYMHDAPLDMRMDRTASLDAYTIVNEWSEDELKRILSDYGEEKWAARIAKIILEHRVAKPIETTFELVDVVERAIPKKAREKNSHVAKRTFQALRIATNDELGVLERSIFDLFDCIKKGGRLAIISFHSLEDRIVKNQFRYLATECICPPKQPVCTCDKIKTAKIITRKPIVAQTTELKNNKRAASAKLRVVEKIV